MTDEKQMEEIKNMLYRYFGRLGPGNTHNFSQMHSSNKAYYIYLIIEKFYTENS